MPFFFIGLLASVPFWFLCRQADRECPNCRSMIPLFVAPWNKTRRQWVKGGFFCQRCQIEVDLQGNRVSEDEPPIGTAALRVMVPMLLTPVLAVVVGYFVFFWGKDLIKQQEVMAAEVTPAAPLISRRPSPVADTFDAGREEIRARIVLHEHGLVHGGDLYSFWHRVRESFARHRREGRV